MFAVIFETAYTSKVLFTGSLVECKAFRNENPEFCGDFAFIQAIEEGYFKLAA